MIVDTPKEWHDEQRAEVQAVVRNAVRLLEDAALLQTYERYGTAHMLATLACEEVGKVALKCWGDGKNLRAVDRRWSYHVRKQAAAACLIVAKVVRDQINLIRSEGKGASETPGHPDHDELVEKIARIMRSDESKHAADAHFSQYHRAH